MFLSAALFILFSAGCWLYCLTDAALTPAAEFPGMRKRTWITVIVVTFVFGAATWVIARRSRHSRPGSPAPADQPALADYYQPNVRWYADYPMPIADASRTDYPRGSEPTARQSASTHGDASHSGPIGPDDDPEFLRQLAERIRGED
jgi:hypothetical protein